MLSAPPTVRILRGLDVESEGTGISRPLSENVNLLGGLLGHAIREQAGPETLERVEALRRLCKRAAAEEDDALRREAAAAIAELDEAEIQWLLRAYTSFFHLVNQAEKQEILRINRERSRRTAEGAARPESIDEAVGRLKADGRTLEEVLELVGRLDIQPTLTAHPTEARRRTILEKQRRIADLLSELRRPDATAAEAENAVDAVYAEISLLLATDEIRAERPSVEDEVEQGLYFLQGSIWETAPRIHRDLQRAIERHYGQAAEPPVFLRWRSWIGSDRDGNPNVTPELTRRTAARQRQVALELHLSELAALRRELSLSDRQVAVPEPLARSLAADDGADPETAGPQRHEAYRRKIAAMMARLEGLLRDSSAEGYDAGRYLEDLELLKTSLEAAGFAEVAARGRLARVRVLARTFGFHLAALDVRQHSRVHEEAVAALLSAAGVVEDYTSLAEEEKLEVLGGELRNPRPLVGAATPLPEEARSTLETFGVIRELLAREPAAVGSYIVSMTHAVSDLLEPLLLAKEAGCWRVRDGRVETLLDVVPLFETIEDLALADERLAAAFDHPVYRLQLEARGGFQEIMLGYSDSNKDGGYWMANWALHRAQDRIARVCGERAVAFRLFHGRGGTAGRGGGRANLAILAMPPSVHNGRIRVTEQGEVISFRYALPGIAHRHTEQLVSAMLRATAASRPAGGGEPEAEAEALMERLAQASMRAYRELIDDPGFWEWYVRATPIEQISGLPIASRPVSRKAAAEVDFEGLRAIPWVFAWTQTRYIVPGWYGIGAAFHQALDDGSDSEVRRLYAEWPFFRAVLDNAEREMARARLEIAALYDARVEDGGGGFHARIERDFADARSAILRITGRRELLDDSPVIQKSIALRNPYTDVLNLLQLELLRRWRASPAEERGGLRELLFVSINGIAAAMQSTG